MILNPLLADGQVHGGLARRAAQALIEEFRYDPDGNPLTSNFADYPVISATELPMFNLVLETPTHINLWVQKNRRVRNGWSHTAIQNAVIDALSHLGVQHIDMPLTPERFGKRSIHVTALITIGLGDLYAGLPSFLHEARRSLLSGYRIVLQTELQIQN